MRDGPGWMGLLLLLIHYWALTWGQPGSSAHLLTLGPVALAAHLLLIKPLMFWFPLQVGGVS